MTANHANSTNDSSRDFDEFKLLAEQGREYFSYYLRSVALYIAVLGALLKFFFDAKEGARLPFFLFGVIFNIAVLIAMRTAISVYKTMAVRHTKLSEKLDLADVYYPPTINTSKLYLGIAVISTIVWNFLYCLR